MRSTQIAPADVIRLWVSCIFDAMQLDRRSLPVYTKKIPAIRNVQIARLERIPDNRDQIA